MIPVQSNLLPPVNKNKDRSHLKVESEECFKHATYPERVGNEIDRSSLGFSSGYKGPKV